MKQNLLVAVFGIIFLQQACAEKPVCADANIFLELGPCIQNSPDDIVNGFPIDIEQVEAAIQIVEQEMLLFSPEFTREDLTKNYDRLEISFVDGGELGEGVIGDTREISSGFKIRTGNAECLEGVAFVHEMVHFFLISATGEKGEPAEYFYQDGFGVVDGEQPFEDIARQELVQWCLDNGRIPIATQEEANTAN